MKVLTNIPNIKLVSMKLSMSLLERQLELLATMVTLYILRTAQKQTGQQYQPGMEQE